MIHARTSVPTDRQPGRPPFRGGRDDLDVSHLTAAFRWGRWSRLGRWIVQTAIGSARRNMPEALQDELGTNAPSETQSAIEQLIAAGMPAPEVADAVHDAVVENSFWILTHEESKAAVTERARQIVEGINPTPSGFV